MRKLILRIYVWFFWKHFLCGLKSVLGHKTIASAIREKSELENQIRIDNLLEQNESISWSNSENTDRVIFAKYITLRHFCKIGEMLVYFKNVDRKRIYKQKDG